MAEGKPENSMQTVEEILATLAAEDRVCPEGGRWNELWLMLLKLYEEGLGGEFEPPRPLVLAACGESNSAKHQRLEDHLRYAKEIGVLDEVESFLMSLTDDEWDCGDINSTTEAYYTDDEIDDDMQ